VRLSSHGKAGAARRPTSLLWRVSLARGGVDCRYYNCLMDASPIANLGRRKCIGESSVKKRTKSRAVRSSKAWSTATVTVDIRSIIVDSRGKRWRWVVDDRMRDYGDIDYERRIIRINRAMHARNRESLIDTLFHEELHRLLPYLGERAVCALTRLLLPTLSTRYRRWLYARIRQR
jgi:hypothetical protein